MKTKLLTQLLLSLTLTSATISMDNKFKKEETPTLASVLEKHRSPKDEVDTKLLSCIGVSNVDNGFGMRDREINKLRNLNEWLTHLYDGNTDEHVNGGETTLGDLKNQALSMDRTAALKVLRSYQRGYFGIPTNNHFIKLEFGELVRAFITAHGRKDFGDILEDAFDKNYIPISFGGLENDFILERYREIFTNMDELGPRLQQAPYCYLHDFLNGWPKHPETLSKRPLPKNALITAIEKLDEPEIRNSTNDRMFSLLTEPQTTSHLDEYRDARVFDGTVILRELKTRAFSLDLEAFKLLINSYKHGYFGIPTNPETAHEAAHYLALFSLTGIEEYLNFHAQTLTENWFGVVFVPGFLTSEQMALHSQIPYSYKARRLFFQPPFCEPEKITKESVLNLKEESKGKKSNRNDKLSDCTPQ